MRPRTRQFRLIGQELALVFSEFSFVPVIAQHQLGLANTMADSLSRLTQPCSCVILLRFDKGDTCVSTYAYYRTVTRELPRSWRSLWAPTQEPREQLERFCACQMVSGKILARTCKPHGVEVRHHPENRVPERRGYTRGRPELRASCVHRWAYLHQRRTRCRHCRSPRGSVRG